MGATIDYAIVIDQPLSGAEAGDGAQAGGGGGSEPELPHHPHLGHHHAVAGFLIGGISTDATIGSVGQTWAGAPSPPLSWL